jgi:hypothetical protein
LPHQADEVRVQYSSLRNLAAGDHIRFVCGPRRRPYPRQTRGPLHRLRGDARRRRRAANVDPREQQPADIRRVYGPEKEALGVPAIEIELLQPATV